MIMDEKTLETLCLDFDQAVAISPQKTVEGDLTAESQKDESGQYEDDRGLGDSCYASNTAQLTCSDQVQTSQFSERIGDLNSKVQKIKMEHALLRDEVKDFTADSLFGSEYVTALQNLSMEHNILKKKCLEECSERKKLYNEVIELKGNIRVFCRCRPLKQDETANGSTAVIDFESSQENELNIISSDTSRKQFKFDHVFRPEDNQDAIFFETQPIVTSVLDGYNVCIFAYGQTGTGKTYTMEGTPENRGVNYRTLEELFRLSNERSSIVKYELFVSMLEVYNEKIRDLLLEHSKQPVKKLEIKQSAEGTQEVPGLVEARVYGTGEVWDLLTLGSRARSVGSTNANELSSRSHCLLRVTVMGENKLNGQRTKSHLWLVDLAGSERVGRIEVEGERLKESQFINKSLSALGDVISALASKTSHVPYRNSKLTHMLQSSLGGDCKTLMFVQISPDANDLGETICSLNFASRVRGVQHGPARKQADHSETFKYKQLLEKAKQEEKDAKKLQDSLDSLQLRFSAREHICRNLQEKVRDLENQLAEERKTRIKQETRALATVSSAHSAFSSSLQKTLADKKPPLAPPPSRLPLRSINNFSSVSNRNNNTTSFLPVVHEQKPGIMKPKRASFLPSVDEDKPTMMKPRRASYHPAVNEDKENTVTRTFQAKQAIKARRGSFVPVKRAPPQAGPIQAVQPRRRASIATLRPEQPMRTPLNNISKVGSRDSRFMGRSSNIWDRQSVWRALNTSSSPLQQQLRENVEATPVGPRSSSKFRGSPPSQAVPGSWRPKHPTVVALQKKHLVVSPLRARGIKFNSRKSIA